MSNVLADARLGEIAIALLLAEFDGVPLEDLPEALKDLENELVTLGICNTEEASAVNEEMLAMLQKIHTLSTVRLEASQEEQAARFARQYPPEVLESIKQLRACEGANTPSH